MHQFILNDGSRLANRPWLCLRRAVNIATWLYFRRPLP